MEIRKITEESIAAFAAYLVAEEKSEATIVKYRHDIRYFAKYANDRTVNKELILAYKEKLSADFVMASANSMLAALNTFFKYMGWQDQCVKLFKVQRSVFRSEEKELSKAEYIRLVQTAEKQGNERLALLLQTICATGIRVSELMYITREAVLCGEAVVTCKGKTRKVFLVSDLRKKLLNYAKVHGIHSGPVFTTKRGKPMDRSNIWREMKSLCLQAGVSVEKVYPHNLRHVFAQVFYEIEKDIAKLADILGHSSINTTRIYIMTTGAEHKRRMETMRLIL